VEMPQELRLSRRAIKRNFTEKRGPRE